MSQAYRVERDSIQHKFADSRGKIQFFGGGFANGKTTAGVAKCIRIAIEYPGSNILVARATRPKLNDTVRKVLFKWLPAGYVKSFNKTENVLELNNGTVINFRHIIQQGKQEESTTSNLLSATYDFIFVDQIDDPEITYKDFLDLLGRLRGTALYRGDDPTMPRTGPRWMALTANPTRGWVYRKLILPLHLYAKRQIKHPDLIVDRKTGKPLIELFEGSTYTNSVNLAADYITTLESTYTGQMGDRYLKGEWAGYEGLVYPQYDEAYHVVSAQAIRDYVESLEEDGIAVEFVEGYDHGLAQQACYLLAFTDHRQNTIIVDGIYEKEKSPEWIANEIKRIRAFWGVNPRQMINADPAVFRRGPSSSKVVGKTVADMFSDCGVRMQRGDSSIQHGIAKVQQYLRVEETKLHPFTGAFGAPSLYISDALGFVMDEITDYYWERNKHDEHDEKPRDRRDHAMDTIKYMLSKKPKLAFIPEEGHELPPWLSWHEMSEEDKSGKKGHRYGRAN